MRTVQSGPTVDRMASTLDDAVASEIRAEIARRGLSRNDVALSAGINPRTWSRYFVKRDRDIPLSAIVAACSALGMPVTDLIDRAEAQLSNDPDDLFAEMTPKHRARVAPLRPDAPTSADS